MHNRKDPTRYDRWFLAVLVAVVAIWLTNFFAARAMQDGDLPQMGQLGDLFGASNALFSAIALAALIVTLLMQREELRLQRDQIERATFPKASIDFQGVHPLEVKRTDVGSEFWQTQPAHMAQMEWLVVLARVRNTRPSTIYPGHIHVHSRLRNQSFEWRELSKESVLNQGQGQFVKLLVHPPCLPATSIVLQTQDGSEWVMSGDDLANLNEQAAAICANARKANLPIRDVFSD